MKPNSEICYAILIETLGLADKCSEAVVKLMFSGKEPLVFLSNFMKKVKYINSWDSENNGVYECPLRYVMELGWVSIRTIMIFIVYNKKI